MKYLFATLFGVFVTAVVVISTSTHAEDADIERRAAIDQCIPEVGQSFGKDNQGTMQTVVLCGCLYDEAVSYVRTTHGFPGPSTQNKISDLCYSKAKDAQLSK